MLSDLLPSTECSFYRWESQDLTNASAISELHLDELRDFLSPKITFLDSTSQIIFGARVCFAATFPGQWRQKARTAQVLKDYQLDLRISNSTTSSGKIVTAGYLLFKAPRTTHRSRFLQSLRLRLPSETPFFDILLFHRTPMEQKINHLVVQCGENHVSPLSKALSALLTGRNSALFLPRLALSRLTPAQIGSYFDMHDRYTKSLKSIPLFPMLSNLDKPRKEYLADGTILERSTRDWAATIFEEATDLSAKCEVVNGGFDQKAYLLVPAPHFSTVSDQFRQYRLRLNPIERREARFRDSLPGLPDVIHIDHSTQQTLDLLATMSSMEVWQRAPPAVRGDHSDQEKAQEATKRAVPTPATVSQGPSSTTNGILKGSRSGTRNVSLVDDDTPSPPGPNTYDDQTSLTQSETQSAVTYSMMSNTTSRRLSELEVLLRKQEQDSAERDLQSQAAVTRLTTIETKLGRIDKMEEALRDNSEKLVLTMECQQDTHVQIVDLNVRVSRLMDVMDRLATKLESATEFSHKDLRGNTQMSHTSSTPDTTRRRTLEEMSVSTASTKHHSARDASLSLPPRDNSSSPPRKLEKTLSSSKKKSRPLHDEMEEMSLGSNEDDGNMSPHPGSAQTLYPLSSLHQGESLLDDSSDEFSSHEEVLPNLDTQYAFHSDPEGGDSS